ncbi:MAG: DUF1302 domain-containing protein [Pseudomonadota bacterium]
MNNEKYDGGAGAQTTGPRSKSGLMLTVLGISAAVCSSGASAVDIETPNKDLKVRWDNTFKYTGMQRLKNPAAALIADPNQDDADRNFKKGLVSSRVDWLSEIDVSYDNIGARLSAAAWYDAVYNRGNNNDSPFTVNAASAGQNDFIGATKKLHGKKAELLDAFVFGKFNVGDMRSTIRAGKHTLVYGETLFFGANGIAAAQGPVDVIKLLSVPNSQFKELLMPVQQISGQLQLNSSWALGAYYQLEWKATRLPGVGSYFSTLDFLDAGGERIFVAPGASFNRAANIEARNGGQGGLQAKFRPPGSDGEYGFYAARYHEKTPQVYLTPGAGFNPVTGQVGEYRLVYPEGIKTVGASYSTLLGDANVAAELSFRSNMPLVGNAQIDLAGTGDNSGKSLYPVGRSAHLNLSTIYGMGQSSLYDNAILTAELGFNRLISVTRNRAALDANTARHAWGLRLVFEPNYYQVLPGLDVAVPIGLGYNPAGNSAVVGAFNGGADNGGDLSIGIKGAYLEHIKISLNYSRFLGTAKPTLNPSKGNQFNFGQAMRDRDYISLSLQSSF